LPSIIFNKVASVFLHRIFSNSGSDSSI